MNSAKKAMILGLMSIAASPNMFTANKKGNNQCTGKGNNNSPISKPPKKKGKFGVGKKSKKQRKKLKTK